MISNKYADMTIEELIALREKINQEVIDLLEKQKIVIDEMLAVRRGKPVSADASRHPREQEETSK